MSLKKQKYLIGLISYMCAMPLLVSAQKLPNIQAAGVWLPETVKIDGKLNEWADGLSANNKANHLQYTLANDDKYLYLAIKSDDKVIIGKIMAGGINIIIGLPGDKSKATASVTYPLSNLKYGSNASAYLDSGKIKEMTAEAKEIGVLNFKAIPDSLISIYNAYNIKSVIKHTNGKLIYELILPLDIIGITASENPKFNYTIKLKGLVRPPISGPENVPPPPLGLPAGRSPTSTVGMLYEMEQPTSFSGEYLLSKK